MPVRIYALAKELNLDGKELVEICKKAGISGKGSALASLDDDEVTKVHAFLDKSTVVEEPEEPAIVAPDPAATRARGPIKVVTSKRQRGPLSLQDGESENDDEPQDSETIEVEDVEETPEVEEVIDTPAAPDPTESLRANKAIKVFGTGSKESDPEKKKKRPLRRSEPVIKLASMPEIKDPAPAARANEKAQKPEVRLTDAIKKATGKQAPLKHLTPTDLMKTVRDEVEPPKDPATDQRGHAKGKDKKKWRNEDAGLAGMATARADRQKQRKRREDMQNRAHLDTRKRRMHRTLTRTGKNTAAPRKTDVVLELPCTVRTFSEATGVAVANIQSVLMGMGAMVTINAQIDEEMVDFLLAELEVDVEVRSLETLEDTLISAVDEIEDDPADLQQRPPVITFLGHVDHGKTSLLDYLIGIDVVSGEAGGITQHIRAYQIEKDGKAISFVDTPGHEAFTEMRARGANVTDIAVLVIAADDGIMPQTEEAISHVKAAGVPIIVALNKMDLPGADPERAMSQLPTFELTPSEWGGDIEVVKTSAITGDGMDQLLETILTIAELYELTANPNRPGQGICLEAQQEPARGVIAKIIVKNGTVNVGDVVVCGGAHGRVKAMYDTLDENKQLQSAGPSVPVNITGLDIAPEAGDAVHVLSDITSAREIAGQRSDRSRAANLSGSTTKISFEDFQSRLEEGTLGNTNEVTTLNLIIRADVRGSIEAIRKELGKLHHDEVQVRILQASVGAVTAGDVILAAASEAVIVGFNVIPDEGARVMADEKQVEIRRYDIIYKVTDDIKLLLEGKLKPEEQTVELGHAVVKRVFSISRLGSIAGCYVVRGNIERGCRIRVSREGRIIGDYPLDSLKREKDDAKQVREGFECGIKLSGFNDVKKDDTLEAYRVEQVARTL